MSCRNRHWHTVNDEEPDGGVVQEVAATNDGADLEGVFDVHSADCKTRDVELIAAEISTIDAISTGVKLPVDGLDEMSDTTSVSDDTPPSTPSSRGSSGRRRSRKRTISLQDSHVSSSSSPARGVFRGQTKPPGCLAFARWTCRTSD